MKTAVNLFPQGDVLFRRVGELPAGTTAATRAEEGWIVAHSETGHHHRVAEPSVAMFEIPGDPFVCYLQLGDGGPCDVEHLRAWDTHETLRLLGRPGDVWEVRRQREHTPEGWRRVAD